jgi:hypothetical protein
MKKLLAGCLVGVMGVTAGMPATGQAGQREWATAGKILTGVVIGSVLAEACLARPAVVCRREVVVERPMLVPCRVVERRYCGPPHMEISVTTTRRWVEPGYCHHRPVRTEPVIIYHGYGRRLYQPPVHGHPAFLQVYSEVRGEWVSVREHPSIY